MSYTLKSIRYHNEPRKILLQNENGPCPLLAAANALLLRGVISLPPSCIKTNSASIDDVVNTLAERALRVSGSDLDKDAAVPPSSCEDRNRKEGREFQVDELLSIFPSLQYGMDVNPKLAAGPTGVEYTKNLSAFDLMGVELVHGWLVDPQDVETKDAIGTRTYNELVEVMVKGDDAKKEIQRLEGLLEGLEEEVEALDEAAAIQLSQADADADTDADARGPDQAEAKSESESEEKHDDEWVDISPSNTENETHTDDNDNDNKDKDKDNDDTKDKDNDYDDSKDVKKDDNDDNDDNKDDIDKDDKDENKTDTPAPTQDDDDNKTGTDLTNVKDFLHNLDNDLELSNRLDSNPTLLAQTKRHQITTTQTLLATQHQIQTASSVVTTFLTSTSNQLTMHGLSVLNQYVRENSIYVFFRNNHFATLTKESGVLYLLVTDLGYAGVNEVVWEKLDDVTGDTEYTDDLFEASKPRDQSEVDYQLALQLSQDGVGAIGGSVEEREVASAIEASILENEGGRMCNDVAAATAGNNDDDTAFKLVKNDEEVQRLAKKVRDDDRASEELAQRLQAEEERRPSPGYNRGGNGCGDQKKGCIIC